MNKEETYDIVSFWKLVFELFTPNLRASKQSGVLITLKLDGRANMHIHTLTTNIQYIHVELCKR